MQLKVPPIPFRAALKAALIFAFVTVTTFAPLGGARAQEAEPAGDTPAAAAAAPAEAGGEAAAVDADGGSAEGAGAETSGAPTEEGAAGGEPQGGLVSNALGGAVSLIELGGPVVIVLLLLSTAGLAVVLYKYFALSHYSGRALDRLDGAVELWAAGNGAEAVKKAGAIRLPAGEVLASGMEMLRAKRADDQVIREEVTRLARNEVTRLHRMLRFLEQIAQVAPVLGLLGTVLGMIEVFQGLETATRDVEAGQLAGGIWEALLTTAVGLSVAIPFGLSYAGLDTMATNIQHRFEDQLTRLFTSGPGRTAP